MVYDVLQIAQNYLINHNEKPLSFYDQMMLRQSTTGMKTVEKAKEPEEKKKKEKNEEMLDLLIQQELQRQENMEIRETEDEWEDETTKESPIALDFQRNHRESTTIKWKKRSVIGKGSFGICISAVNLETNKVMSVKEVILQSHQKEQVQ